MELLSLEQSDVLRDDAETRVIFDRMWQFELTQRQFAKVFKMDDGPLTERVDVSMDTIFARAQAEKADLTTYRASPRGMFSTARNNAEDLARKVGAELEAVWSANQRGPGDIPAALAALNEAAARLQAEIILMNVHAKEMAK